MISHVRSVIAHTTSPMGHVKNANATHKAENHVTIAGIANHRIHNQATSQDTTHPISIIFAISVGFSDAHAAKDCNTGIIACCNCAKAGANAPPTDSMTSQKDWFIICPCHSIVLPNASACQATVPIKAHMISCFVAHSSSSIQYSFNTLVLPVVAIATIFVALA